MGVGGPPLACTVRGCHKRLDRLDRALVCVNGHCFDIARSGYVNLLQPQDRRSLSAGDSTAALDARARLLAVGVGHTILDGLVRLAKAHAPHATPVVVDLGCGTGEGLAALSSELHGPGIGIDLSTQAIDRASRQFAHLTWVVANADRRLPLADASVDLIVSINARRNPPECARVLKPSGVLLVAVPAVDDLVELRAFVQGTAVASDRSTAVVDEHAACFTLTDRATLRERPHLAPDALRDLLAGTYRGARHSAKPAMDHLMSMDVTLATDVFLFTPGPTRGSRDV